MREKFCSTPVSPSGGAAVVSPDVYMGKLWSGDSIYDYSMCTGRQYETFRGGRVWGSNDRFASRGKSVLVLGFARTNSYKKKQTNKSFLRVCVRVK